MFPILILHRTHTYFMSIVSMKRHIVFLVAVMMLTTKLCTQAHHITILALVRSAHTTTNPLSNAFCELTKHFCNFYYSFIFCCLFGQKKMTKEIILIPKEPQVPHYCLGRKYSAQFRHPKCMRKLICCATHLINYWSILLFELHNLKETFS